MEMVGVTIGVFPEYEALAKFSANCFQQMTGLRTVVLDTKLYQSSELPHPAALKMKVFDFVSDDQIVYFDADWICINRWNPIKLAEESRLACCSDFFSRVDFPRQYLQKGAAQFESCPTAADWPYADLDVRTEYEKEIRQFSGLTLPCEQWINTGFWIASREAHEPWLQLSLGYYRSEVGHHPEYFEQPAMNKALEALHLDVHYMKRKYNTLVSTRSKWPDSLIGLHVKLRRNREFLRKLANGEVQTPDEVRSHFCGG